MSRAISRLQRTAAHCNALQHTATLCDIPHTAHCNTVQYTAAHCNKQTCARKPGQILSIRVGAEDPGVLKCVAVCCSALQCVAVRCNALQCVEVCCSVLQCVAVCCSVLQCVAVCCSALHTIAICCSVSQGVRTKYPGKDGRISPKPATKTY